MEPKPRLSAETGGDGHLSPDEAGGDEGRGPSGAEGRSAARPRPATWHNLVAETFESWNDHGASTQSAALAFFTMFSMAPVLIVAIALAGAAFGREAVRGQIFREFQAWMGPQAASLIQQILRSAARPSTSRLATLLGTLTLVFGTTGVFVQLQESLNTIWGVTPRPGAVFTTLLRKRALSFAVVVSIGFLLAVSLILSTALNALGGFLEAHFAISAHLLEAGNQLVTFILVTLLFSLIYRLLPDAVVAWREVVLGAIVTAALFGIGKVGIGFYLGHTGIASAYGAAGSLVMILSWVYYSSLIFLLGAEFTHSYAKLRHGGPPQPEEGAMRRPGEGSTA